MAQKNIFIRVWKEVRPFHAVVGFYLFLIIIDNILVLALPYIVGKSTDIIVSNQGYDLFVKYVLLATAVLVLARIFQTILNLFENTKFTFPFEKFLSLKTINKILTFSIGQVRNENSGLTQSVVTRGQGRMHEIINNVVYGLLPSIIKTVISVVAMLFINVILGVITFVGCFVFITSSILMNRRFSKELRASFDAEDEMNKNSTEIIRFSSHITLNAEESFAKSGFIKNADDYVKRSIKVWNRFEIFSMFRGFSIVATKLAVFFLSGLFVYQNKISIGEFIIINTWINIATSELGFISRMHRRITNSIEAISKYFDVLSIKPAITNDPKIDREIIGEIEFNDVTFEYPTEKIIKKTDKNDEDLDEKRGDALKNVSFKMYLGEKLAIVGKSGSGKSTLINLLCRGYDPQSGQILIDGYDLKDYDYKKYRMNLGVVEQDVVLLDRTLKENLLFGIQDKESITDEKLIEVCRQATLNNLLEKLPQKLETKVGERGVKLSGGEKQRVGIARALLRNPKILIFDEATSHLDPLNEKLIKESIDKASTGRTTIIIAHRLSTVMDADKILVMNDGVLIDEGKHTDLVSRCEIYRDLVNSQIID